MYKVALLALASSLFAVAQTPSSAGTPAEIVVTVGHYFSPETPVLTKDSLTITQHYDPLPITNLVPLARRPGIVSVGGQLFELRTRHKIPGVAPLHPCSTTDNCDRRGLYPERQAGSGRESDAGSGASGQSSQRSRGEQTHKSLSSSYGSDQELAAEFLTARHPDDHQWN